MVYRWSKPVVRFRGLSLDLRGTETQHRSWKAGEVAETARLLAAGAHWSRTVVRSLTIAQQARQIRAIWNADLS